MKFKIRYLGVALFSILTGCVTPQPLVKDVLADPEAHLVSNFTETKLSESVRNALGITVPGSVKRRVAIDTVMTNIEKDDKESFDKTNVFHVLDNGLVRSMVQTGNNGILSFTEFDLSYHGVFNLIYQSISHNANSVYSPTYTKAISKLDAGIASPKESTEYVFEYAMAPEIQIMNFQTQRTVCKTGKWFAANTLHAKLPGLALPVDCEYFGRNGQTFLKLESVFIRDLGLTLERGSTTSARKRVWKIIDVKS